MMHHVGQVNASDLLDSMNFAEKLRKGEATLQQVPDTVKKYFSGAEGDMDHMLNYMKDPSTNPVPDNIKSVLTAGKANIMSLFGLGGENHDNKTPKDDHGGGGKAGTGTMTASLLIVSFGIAIGFTFC